MRNIYILIVSGLLLAIGSHTAFAQISGNSTPMVGSPAETYTYNTGASLFSPNWRMDFSRGTINSQWQSGTAYSISITWNTPGNETLVLLEMSSPVAQLPLTIMAAPPPVPTANAATNVATSTFIANWTTVAGASSYQLDVSTSSTFSGGYVSGYFNRSVLGASHTVTGLIDNTTYHYRLRSVGSSGSASGNSNKITLTTAPAAPVASAATNVMHDSFTANWAASSGATTYLVDVSTFSNFSSFTSTGASLSPLSITGLSANTTYYYRVRAGNANGVSGGSNVISFTTLPPAPPVFAASSITASSFTANWGTVSGATNYLLYVSAASDFSSFLGGYNGATMGVASSSTISGLLAGTTYYYKVKAENSGWTTGFSSVIPVLTLPSPPVGMPATSITASSFTANWSMASSASGYRLDVSEDFSFGPVGVVHNNLTVSGTTQNVSGLIAGKTYYYRARAINSSGTSGNSGVVSVILLPAPPTATAATNHSTTSFVANWSSVAVATSYQLDVSTVNTFASFVTGYNGLLVNTTSRAVTGLAIGTTYYFRVRSANGTGTSINSNTITVATLLDPPMALGSTSITSSSFTANWNASTNATSYKLDVSTKSDFSTLVPGYADLTVATTTKNVTGLVAKTTYYYRVRAVNVATTSANSNIVVGVDLDQNFLRTVDVTVAGKTTPALVESATINEKMTNYNFFDGLGRSSQTVAQQASSSQKDIIQPIVYDPFSREAKKYLPYTDETNGWYKPNALRDPNSTGSAQSQYQTGKQYLFYQTGGVLANSTFPYAETRIETSPLNRTLEQGSPGQAHQPDATDTYASTDRTIKFAYEANVASSVLKWTYTYPTTTYPLGLVNAGTAAAPIYYPANQLYLTKTKDENYNEVLEWKNKDGQVVLKKVQGPGGSWAQTYYSYDDYGTLVCVLPPEAIATLSTDYYQTGATDATKDAFLKRWAFRYAYDARRRMSLKQVPGAEPVYMVYDKRDRVVLTQDGNQRSQATKYWTFTKYDELNRPILTGLKDTAVALTQSAMQGAVDVFYNKTWPKLFETYVGSVAGSIHGYTNKSYPVVNVAATIDVNRYLTATYYDKYDFRSTWVGTYTYMNEALSQTVNGVTYTQPTAENPRVTGLVTGTKVKVLDGGIAGGFTWLKAINYYDDKNRPVQVQSENYKGGIDRVSNVYDFTGKVLKSKTTHVQSDVTWKDIVGARQQGNKLIRTVATAGWGTSGSASVQQLAAGQNGWLEVTASEITTPRMIGLSDVNTNADYTTIDFALYQLNTGALHVYESGTNRGQFGTYAPGDILKIERTGTVIKYYRNGTLLYTSLIASSSVLMADAAFHALDATLVNVRTSFSTTKTRITRRFDYDHAGRLLRTWHKLNAPGQDSTEYLLAHNTYNELGQPVDKKLHSTATDGSNAKQSVDYRYNIRGWLSSINNAELANNTTNDDTGDYFGMNLAYHEDLLTGNNTNLQYNGNISGIKWSVNQGYGTLKAMAYNFVYDPMNRLTSATHKQATTLGTWVTGQFDESGFGYDLNGNITALQRKGDNGVVIDNLVYNYGTGTTASNKLLYVQDNATDVAGKPKGFNDGNPGTAIDYTYDANGSMITDLNKGISSAIGYNYLNLPEAISKGGNGIRYIYDAAGRKLSQVTSFPSNVIQTDYAGEFIYENDALQFVNHEEGRIAMSAQQNIFTSDGSGVAGLTAINGASAATVVQNGNQTYIRVTSNGTAFGGLNVTTPAIISAAPGDRFKIRAKGYRTGTSPVYILAKTNLGNISAAAYGPALATSTGAEVWVEETVIIPAGANQLLAYVLYNTSTNGEQFFLNDLEVIKLTANAPEYQYHLKDHLGNVRVTFTTKDETLTYTANLENASQTTEQAAFRNYSRVTNDLFDHTDAGAVSDKAQMLHGGNNSQVGLAKSIAVMPGDVITAQVYAKHLGTTGSSGNLTGFASALLSAFGLPAPLAGETGTAAAALQSYGAFIAGGGNPGNATWTKGFLNVLIFDKNYNLIDLAYQQLDAQYVQAVGSSTKAPHGLLTTTKTIKEPGYVYIYLSNEGATQKDIYFDDMSISHTKSKVIQANDYYPFGLTFNSYQRENSVGNNCLYNQGTGDKKFNTERVFDLGLNVDFSKLRTYDPAIGRWWQVDPLADEADFTSLTPYNYSFNNPARYNDPYGDCPRCGVIPIIPIALGGGASVVEGFTFAGIGSTLVVLIDQVIKKAASAHGAGYSAAVGMAMSTSKPGEISSLLMTKEKSPGAAKGDRIKNQTEKELESSKSSLEKNVKDHKEKLEDYTNDPDKYDNKGKLRDAPSPEIREKIINGRIKELKDQVNKNQGELDKVNKQLEELKKANENSSQRSN